MILISSKKIRTIISAAKTEQDIVFLLRSHKIRYKFTTETGFLSLCIPYKKGCFRIYKVSSRSCPFVMRYEMKGVYKR